jgi:transposase
LIAEARIKTDKIDAAILARLYASALLPEVWTLDDATLALHRQVARRTHIVRQRTRLKYEIHAVLAGHLIAPCPASDLFGKKGRSWLAEQPLPLDERIGVEQRLRTLDLFAHHAKQIEEMLARSALSQPQVAAHKRRQLELRAGMPAKRCGHKGLGADYNLKAIRDQEWATAGQVEKVYQKLFSRWRQAKPKDAQPCPWYQNETRTKSGAHRRRIGLVNCIRV